MACLSPQSGQDAGTVALIGRSFSISATTFRRAPHLQRHVATVIIIKESPLQYVDGTPIEPLLTLAVEEDRHFNQVSFANIVAPGFARMTASQTTIDGVLAGNSVVSTIILP